MCFFGAYICFCESVYFFDYIYVHADVFMCVLSFEIEFQLQKMNKTTNLRDYSHIFHVCVCVCVRVCMCV